MSAGLAPARASLSTQVCEERLDKLSPQYQEIPMYPAWKEAAGIEP